MSNWVALGGGNSGIVGDLNHGYGFHLGARYVSRNDYSRMRDPNGPDGPFVHWDYACSGDFSHKNLPELRAEHARVLSGLTRGEYPMICEFIGKPWTDQPVIYWARWNGLTTIQKYTGSGHDHWSHITWYRSKVDQPANLWIPHVHSTEDLFGGIMLPRKGNKTYSESVEFWQRVLGKLGYSVGKYPTGHAKAGQEMYDGFYWKDMEKAVNKSRDDIRKGVGNTTRITPWHAQEMLDRLGMTPVQVNKLVKESAASVTASQVAGHLSIVAK